MLRCITAKTGILAEIGATMNDQQNKRDGGKMRPSYLPWRAIGSVLRVLEFGARKYKPHSWQLVEPDRYCDALLRHAIEFGERLQTDGPLMRDTESGCLTLGHLVCNALFLMAHPALIPTNPDKQT
jgi:hypothetical protein